jgi:predicted alpha/beta-hydrolase family hydrolase
VFASDQPRGAVALGHGAGGGIGSPDLLAARDGALAVGFTAALIEQPYRVAGRRSPAPPSQLDVAWIAAVTKLVTGPLRDLVLVVGGRSAGARVACRTAAELRASAVLCLAFPVHPPGRGDDPTKSRLPELEAVELPVLVVQGDADPFGMPPPGHRREVVRVPGTHALRDRDAVTAAVADWLRGVPCDH